MVPELGFPPAAAGRAGHPIRRETRLILRRGGSAVCDCGRLVVASYCRNAKYPVTGIAGTVNREGCDVSLQRCHPMTVAVCWRGRANSRRPPSASGCYRAEALWVLLALSEETR